MLSQDDVLYMIVTDRFCDGDPSNNYDDIDLSDPQRRHGGDLLGIIQRMPYLRNLGVTVLWITPIYVNPPDGYHGYHPFDFEKVDKHLCSESLGPSESRQNIRRFVDIAHEHGLKVMIDLVVSHTSKTHPWLKERPNWYDAQGSTLPEKVWIYGLPSLNHDNINVNLYFVKNVLDWITDSGVDAIRIDAARHVEKPFWSDFKLFAKGLRPNITVVGELWDYDPSAVAPYQDEYDFDSMFDYPLYEAIVDVFAKDQGFFRLARPELSPNEPPGILNLDSDYRNAFQLVTFVGNHDNPRFLSQAGGENNNDAYVRTRLALAFLFSTRGIPQIYYGDELGMSGGSDPDNRRDMAWPLFDDESDQSQEAKRAKEMHSYLRHIIQLRTSSSALCFGRLTTLYVTFTLYAFSRTFFGDIRVVVVNNSYDAVDVTIPLYTNSNLSCLATDQLPEGAVLVDELNPEKNIKVVIESGNVRVKLPGKSAAIFKPVLGNG